jgi:hypothetical protein
MVPKVTAFQRGCHRFLWHVVVFSVMDDPISRFPKKLVGSFKHRELRGSGVSR